MERDISFAKRNIKNPHNHFPKNPFSEKPLHQQYPPLKPHRQQEKRPQKPKGKR